MELLPPGPCSGATREALGNATCMPVGDCDAPFPPPSATHIVDPTADGGTPLVFRTISAAVAAAPSGAVIAVRPGTYLEELLTQKSLTIVGQCAARVVLAPGGPQQVGVSVGGRAARLTVSGLTVRGFDLGAWAEQGATLTLTDVVLEENVEVGAYATGGSRLNVSSSVIRRTRGLAARPAGMGVYVDQGVQLELRDTAVIDNDAAGIYLARPPNALPCTAVIEGAVVMRTRPSTGSQGMGVFLVDANATISRTVVASNHTIGIRVDGPMANARIIDTVVRDTKFGPAMTNASGVQAQQGARVSFSRGAVRGNGGAGIGGVGAGTVLVVSEAVLADTTARPTNGLGAGVGASGGGLLELVDSAVVGNEAIGVYVSTGSSATVTRTVVLDTRANSRGGFGRGLEASFDAGVSSTALTIVNSRTHGVVVADSTFEAVDLVIDGVEGQAVAPPLPPFGDGLAVTRSRATLVRPNISRAVGIGALFSGSTGSIDDGRIADNAVGIHCQRGSSLLEVSSLTSLAPLSVEVTRSTRFERNQLKVGAGEVALPDVTSP